MNNVQKVACLFRLPRSQSGIRAISVRKCRGRSYHRTENPELYLYDYYVLKRQKFFVFQKVGGCALNA